MTLCSHARNELGHSLNTRKIEEKSAKVRQAYAAIAPEGSRRRAILDESDADVFGNALRHCRDYIVITTEAQGGCR